MKQPLLILAAAIACTLIGCHKKPTGVVSMVGGNDPPRPPVTSAPEMTSESGEGFADLVFYVASTTTDPDGTRRLRAAGLHKGTPVGFEVVLSPSWSTPPKSKSDPFEVGQGFVVYRSIGAESDAFIRALDQVYGSKANPTKMAAEIKFTALSLQGKPGDLAAGIVKIKCFFEPPKGKEDDEAEFFTNIDLAKNRLELREKDGGYRANIVKALRGK